MSDVKLLDELEAKDQPAASSALNADELALFGQKKKKRGKKVDERFDNEPRGFVDGSGQLFTPTPLYSYQTLLDRIQLLIREHNPDLQGARRYVIKPPQVSRVGSRRVAWVNFKDICKIMQRSQDHVCHFVLAELGTEGSIAGDGQLVLKGRYGTKHIESLLRKYITEYVTCSMCRSPQTTLEKDGRTRLYNISCGACGANRSVSTIKSGFHAVSRADRRKAKQAQ